MAQPPSLQQNEKSIVITGRRAPSEAKVSASALIYLPFDLPPGVTRLFIKRDFDHGPDATRNTVDTGLFDPRGYGFGGPGFRGWQGGVPGDIVLTGDFATTSPHYLPGPLPPGKWHLAQSYLLANAFGLNYRYTITWETSGTKPPAKMPDVPRYEPGVVNGKPGWYAGNLHTHTIHSDGGRTLSDLVARNEAAGFHFLASTDHNTPRTHYDFAETGRRFPNHLLLFGEEFTSPFGHANIIGQRPGFWFDFRMDGGQNLLPAIIGEAHRQKAVFVVNHPFAFCTSCSWRFPAVEWSDADAIEVWNGNWTPEDRMAVDLWDKLLKSGKRFVATGGTDYHRGEDALVPAAWVYGANLSRDAIMDGLRRGRVVLSDSPRGPRVFLASPADKKALPGDTLAGLGRGVNDVPVEIRITGGLPSMKLRLVWATGETTLPVPPPDATGESVVRHDVPRTGRYVRAELMYADNRMASLTNPLFWG